MARNAWRVWGISVAMAGSLAAADKPAELPVRTEFQGRATPVVTEDHFQPEKAPPPRLLPARNPEDKPTTPTPPNVRQAGSVIGLQVPGVATPDLDIPVRASVGDGVPPLFIDKESTAWQARAAYEVAEMHFRSCDTAEARLWYREVIKLAPRSDYATMASERLQQTEIIPAGAIESREPPLADAPPAENIVRIR